jgi:hypothetical protein
MNAKTVLGIAIILIAVALVWWFQASQEGGAEGEGIFNQSHESSTVVIRYGSEKKKFSVRRRGEEDPSQQIQNRGGWHQNGQPGNVGWLPGWP